MQSTEKGKGKYIVFEGLPKCGKSTQANLLYEKLTQKFPEKKIILTKEPGGSEIADVIRKLVQGTPFTEQMTPVCEAYLYAASRAQTLRTVVRPVIDEGGIVLSDRSVLSSKAIQGYARGLGMEKIDSINRIALQNIYADTVYYIDTDPEICYTRAKKEYDGSDKFEAMDLKFFKLIKDGYDSFSSVTMETIPGDLSIEAVHGLILVSVLKLLHGNY